MARFLTLTLTLALGGTLAITLVAAPAPSPPSKKPLTEAQRAAATEFAPVLVSVTRQIAQSYVRPVARFQLLHAALAGLYERAQRQPPATLLNDCQLATDEDSLMKLVLLVCEDVGDVEGFWDAPLLIACQALTRLLDPYSAVVTGEEQRRTTGLEQANRGIGLEIGDRLGNGPVLVKLVKAGGPAQRAGLRPGDEITHLDGVPVSEIAPERLVELLNHTQASGPPSVLGEVQTATVLDRPVQLITRRGGQKQATTVTLERICFRTETILGVSRQDDNSWNYWLDPKERIAHLRLASLAQGTAQELREVVENLQQQGLRGLILDLRWCPGGFLEEAVDCSRLFIGEGVVSTIKIRLQPPQVQRSDKAGPFRDVPLVVLVNGDTLGGGELIAAALQDHGRARVVGQRTFGKASVQTPLRLGPTSLGMKLTTGTFERPNGKNLHRFPESKPSEDWGVRPDDGLEFRISADLNRQLRDWWQEMTLRPGSSRQRLALDEPQADAPQQAALQAVKSALRKN